MRKPSFIEGIVYAADGTPLSYKIGNAYIGIDLEDFYNEEPGKGDHDSGFKPTKDENWVNSFTLETPTEDDFNFFIED